MSPFAPIRASRSRVLQEILRTAVACEGLCQSCAVLTATPAPSSPG